MRLALDLVVGAVGCVTMRFMMAVTLTVASVARSIAAMSAGMNSAEDRAVSKLKAMFDEHKDEYIRFESIENPRHPRPDLCAFLMLHDLLGGSGDMVCSASHDEIWLDVDLELLEEKADSVFIRDLVRCGVRYDIGGLVMFV